MKITAVTLLRFVLLSTALIGITQVASYRGSWRKPPTSAHFEVILQTWSDFDYNANPPTKAYITDEGDMVIKNFR